MKRIQLATLILALVPLLLSAAEAPPEFLLKWGSRGGGDGQFDWPVGVEVDGAHAYVTDHFNHRVQKFDSNGNFLLKWGSFGTADGQFNRPYGVVVNASGHVYVAEILNHRIQKFDSNGNFLLKWGSFGTADGQFNRPAMMAVDSGGRVYVTDFGNQRIQKFDSSGNFLLKWGSFGTGDGQFDAPQGIAVDESGHVYVADQANHRIQKFDNNGNFVAKWGSFGTGDGQLDGPFGIAVDRSGGVYVGEQFNHRIQKFDSNGVFLTKWGSQGSGDGQFNNPHGLAVDDSGHVYVAETGNYRIQKFGPLAVTYDAWFSSSLDPAPFNPTHDCVTLANDTISSDLCGFSGPITQIPLGQGGLTLWVAQVPCGPLTNLVYVGTSLDGEPLSNGAKVLGASVITQPWGTTLAMEAVANPSCTVNSRLAPWPSSGSAGKDGSPGANEPRLMADLAAKIRLGTPRQPQTVANRIYDVWSSSSLRAPPHQPIHDCVRFTEDTVSSDLCGDAGPLTEIPLGVGGMTLWIGQVPCGPLNLVLVGTSIDGATSGSANVMGAIGIGLNQQNTIALEGIENPSCSLTSVSMQSNPYAAQEVLEK